MMDKYILDADGNPQRCDDLIAWARWVDAADRRLARTDFDGQPAAMVSTVFLASDHNYGYTADRTPVLWETMIFGKELGELDQQGWQHTSREDALEGHEAAVQLVRDARGVEIDGLLSVSDRGALDFRFDKHVPVTPRQVGVIVQLLGLAWLLGFDAAPSFDWCEVRNAR